MSELCHICDLFRTALFGPTNTNEDHLDDGLGNDLPRPMADAPATMGVRPRVRPGVSSSGASKSRADPDAVAQPAGGSGATATPSVNSELAHPHPLGMKDAAHAPVSTTATPSVASRVAAREAATREATNASAGSAAPAPPTTIANSSSSSGKPPPKTKFNKRPSRVLKSTPAYMSFDDVDVEEDDSDGELFIEDTRDRRGSGSRSSEGAAAAAAAYTVNAPSVYREPVLTAPRSTPAEETAAAALAPEPRDDQEHESGALVAPRDEAPPAPAYDSGAAAAVAAGMNDGPSSSMGYVEGGDGVEGSGEDGIGALLPPPGGLVASAWTNSGQGIGVGTGADSSAEMAVSGKEGLRLGGLGGNGLAGDRMSIPRDGSTLESARPHGQSESYHGYKGYPGYEPDTPVAAHLTQQGQSGTSDSLTINPGADVADHRYAGKGPMAEPTPTSAYLEPRGGSALGSARPDSKRVGSMESSYAEGLHHHHHPTISPSGTMDLPMPSVPPGDSHLQQQVQVTSSRQQQPSHHHRSSSGVRPPYGSQHGSTYRPSPDHSVANSMASSFRREDSRNISQMPSEDGMGSVLGTLVGTEDSANEDLQWKRSALKKFHKVMVKGEGLRVVKHNRSGGSQMRIIRYDPDIKALVWNSKRYMKKAGAANVPIVGIKRVGREGNTVSVTAAGRGTIGFEPSRIRDAKILAEALRALVDKEERSAMWRG